MVYYFSLEEIYCLKRKTGIEFTMDLGKRKFLIGSLGFINIGLFFDCFKPFHLKKVTLPFKSVSLVRYPKNMSIDQVFEEAERWVDRKTVDQLDKVFVKNGNLLSVSDQLDTQTRSYSIVRTFKSEAAYVSWFNEFQRLSVINYTELKKSPFTCYLFTNV